jgi:thiol:disulfide interchange protein
MKAHSLLVPLLLIIVGTAISPHHGWSAEVPKKARPKLYDESLDGSKQIADALIIAKREHKRVLLQFGANWCGWCHLLHKLFETDKAISERLKADYVVVLVDVNEGHNKDIDTKYGNPMRFGLPVIVILGSDGRQLTTKNTEELEQGTQHDPAKVLAFLKEWEPKKSQ